MKTTKPEFNIKLKFLFVFLIIVTALWPYPAQDVYAASCYGSSCSGYNPESMGCGADAFNADDNSFGDLIVEKRASTTCDAAWERTQNISGSYMYAAGSTRFGCANFCYSYNVVSPDTIANNARVYTVMKGLYSVTPIRCCGKVSSYQILWGSMPVTYNCVGD